MKIKIVTVGKLKEKYLVQGINEYAKRLGAYAKLEFVEVSDENNRKNYPPVLPVKRSTNPTSEAFAKQIDQLGIQGKSQLTFVIGGSLGLSQEVMTRSDAKISFGKMTYPHQLMKLILLEQIYRAYRINTGAPYHK